jgi:hypothetical protein
MIPTSNTAHGFRSLLRVLLLGLSWTCFAAAAQTCPEKGQCPTQPLCAGNVPCGAYTWPNPNAGANPQHVKLSFLFPLITKAQVPNFPNVPANSGDSNNPLQNAMWAINYFDPPGTINTEMGRATVIVDKAGGNNYQVYLYPPGYYGPSSGLGTETGQDAAKSDTCKTGTSELTVQNCYSGLLAFSIPANTPTVTGPGCNPSKAGGTCACCPFASFPKEPNQLFVAINQINKSRGFVIMLTQGDSFTLGFSCFVPSCCT